MTADDPSAETGVLSCAGYTQGSFSPSITRSLGWEDLTKQRVVLISFSSADIFQ